MDGSGVGVGAGVGDEVGAGAGSGVAIGVGVAGLVDAGEEPPPQAESKAQLIARTVRIVGTPGIGVVIGLTYGRPIGLILSSDWFDCQKFPGL